MLANIKHYKYQSIEENNLVVDFAKLYDYISKEDKTNDPYLIGEDFGDNPTYYLLHVLGIEIKSYEDVEINTYNKEVLNVLANDFNNWIEHNKVFEDIQRGID